MDNSTIRFSQMSTYGAHLYRKEGQVAEIVFENTQKGIRKTIVADSGRILDFPGFAHPELLELFSKESLFGWIQFHSYISNLDHQYALIWQIQPDGRYWEDDDGFGGTLDDEIFLYARLDDTGKFIEPFHIYSIGSSKLFGTDAEEQLACILSMKRDPSRCLRKHIPEMLRDIRKKIVIPEEFDTVYNIPGTIYQAKLSLQKEGDKWFVQASISKQYSDSSYIGFLKFLPLEEQKNYLKTKQAKKDAEEELSQLFLMVQRKEQQLED